MKVAIVFGYVSIGLRQPSKVCLVRELVVVGGPGAMLEFDFSDVSWLDLIA